VADDGSANDVVFLPEQFCDLFLDPDFDEFVVHLYGLVLTFLRSILISYLSGHWLLLSICLVLSAKRAS
jgi:hypothetical protein